MSVLAVTSIKGGVGKTTSAVNLAWLSARDGTPTLLWDLDPQGAASFTFRVRPEVQAGCGRLLRDEDALAESIKGTDYPGLDLLPADFSYRKLDAILARADGRRQGLQRPLRALRAGYGRIVLDCPPGFSFLAENVFSGADALVIPTLPTVLSLRTLARLARHLADRRDRCPLVCPFLNLVDRRRSAHRAIADHVRADGRPWLVTAIPQAGIIEQMGVERAPLGAFAACHAAAADVETLWAEVLAALDRPQGEAERRQACRLLADDVERLLAALQPADGAAAAAAARSDGSAPASDGAAEREPGSAAGSADEVEFKLSLAGESDVAALLAAAGLPRQPPVTVEQLHHVFDTDDLVLGRAGCSLRLREECGRYSIVAEVAGSEEAGSGASGAPARDEARLDARWAFDVLAGHRSPLEVLRSRLRGGASPLVERMEELVGRRALRRRASLRHVRQRVGPIRLAEGVPADHPALTLQIDRTDLPDGRVDHGVEVGFPAGEAVTGEHDLRRLFERAGLGWHPVPVQLSP